MLPRAPKALILALALALTACAGTTDPTTPPTKVHEPGEGVALDDGRVELAGKLLAHDGTPLRRAELTVRRDGFREPVASAVLDDHGAFQVSVPAGVYAISVAAVDHHMVLRRTVVTDDLRVEGRLGTYARTEPGEALQIRSQYLDAKAEVVGPGPTSAPRVSEGVHRLELPDKPPEATRLRYQIASPGGRTYNGPLADDYENDGGGDFWSIVDVGSRDALDLDLRTLPPAGQAPKLQWTGESPTTAAVIDFQDRCQEALGDVRARMPLEDGKIAEMTDELRAEIEALATKARAELDAVTDPTTHALLRAAHLSCFTVYLATPDDMGSVREEVAWVLEHVSPTDPHPALLMNFGNAMFRARNEADEAFQAKTEAWLERQAREHPDPNAAIDALSALLYIADDAGNEARVAELYPLSKDERFAGLFQPEFLQKQFDPNRILKRGKPFPAFDFAGLHEGDPRITSADRAGKLYLIEFWATWCGPCVAAMPKLHETYAAINGAQPGQGSQVGQSKTKSKGKPKHKGKAKAKDQAKASDIEDAGLRALQPVDDPRVEFVFVSLDGDPSDVEAFRKEHWSMPWIHAFVGNSKDRKTMERYGFFGVPTMVLVDESGTILEVDGRLRSELRPALEQVLAERAE